MKALPLLLVLLSGCYPWVGDALHEENTACDEKTLWFLDSDGDAFGDDNDTQKSCSAPSGYISVGGDCDPQDGATFPGAADTFGDGVDQDCDACPNGAGDGIDQDCDFYPANEELTDDEVYDCNDNNADVNPGATEIPNDGIDNDCTGEEGVDADGDGRVVGIDDCDDTDENTYLGAPELVDCVDNDCDTLIDEDLDSADDDGDGYCEGFDFGTGLECCPADGDPGDCDDTDPALNPEDQDSDSVTTCDGDCDDLNPSRFPGNGEICDGFDNDCADGVPADEVDGDSDGALVCGGDCDDANPDVGPFDNDLDGFPACGVPADCDDTDPLLNPSDLDGDGDSTCDGDCNDGNAALNVADADGDGDTSCDGDCGDADPLLNLADYDTDGFTTCDGDCDDNDPNAYPDDLDGDGFDACSDGDCNDGDAAIHPGVPDDCDGIDNDCDDVTDEDGQTDVDGDGYNLCQGDCDDLDERVYPGAAEICDGKDSDCDFNLPANELDGDGDGFAECDDCDDSNPGVFPGALEQCNFVDDNCVGGTDEGCTDCDTFVPTDEPTIQAAVDAAFLDEIICVEPGTYLENVVLGGTDVHLVGLYGAGATTIDGQAAGSVLTVNAGESAATVIEGFTITNGAATDGAGINVVNSSTPTLRRLVIVDNHATTNGGGVHTDSISLVWSDLEFRQNTAWQGGGLYGGEVDLSDSLFTENDATSAGGGAGFGGSFQLRNVRLYGNTAVDYGGAVYVHSNPAAGQGTDCAIDDSRIAGNSASDGGGLHVDELSIDVNDSVFTDNSASYMGGAILFRDALLVQLTNLIVERNTSVNDGGGITIFGGSSWIFDSTISGNTAALGPGGLTCDACELHLEDTVVSDNISQQGGPGGLAATMAIEIDIDGVTVANNLVIGDGEGGGAALHPPTYGGTVAIRNSSFTNNTFIGPAAGYGGGLAIWVAGPAVIENTLIAGNQANDIGGGLYVMHEQSNHVLDMRNVILVGNAALRGGGIGIEGNQNGIAVMLGNSVVAGNTATASGGGIYTDSMTTAAMSNVIVTSNVAVAGGGLWVNNNGAVDVESCDVWNNLPDDYSGIADPTGTLGNLSIDPQFAYTAAPDPQDWDLHLALTSTLIDGGDPSILDPDGSDSDIGAYGGPEAALWDLDLDGYYAWWQPGIWPGPPWDCDDSDPSVFPGSGC